MSQADYVVDNGSGAVVRADINAHLVAIASNNSGAAAPTTTYANEWWYDTVNSILKQRDNANTAWINVARKDSEGWIPYYGSALAGGVASVTHNGAGNYVPAYIDGTFQNVTVEADMTILNPGTTNIPSGVAVFMTLQFTIDTTGGYTILFDPAFNVLGLIPTVPNGANDISSYTIWTINGGTTWNLFGDADPTDLEMLTSVSHDDLISIFDVSDGNKEKTIEADRLRNKAKKIFNDPNASGTIVPDFDVQNAYRFNLAGAVIISNPDNPPPAGTQGILEFAIEADGTNDVTWPGNSNWGDALGPPDMSAETDGQVTRVLLETWDSGTTYLAYLLQQGFLYNVAGRVTLVGPIAAGTATSDPVVEAAGASTISGPTAAAMGTAN